MDSDSFPDHGLTSLARRLRCPWACATLGVALVDEAAEAVLELAPVVGQVEPGTVQRALGGDNRIPRLAEARTGRVVAAVDDRLEEVPHHERVRFVLTGLGRIGRWCGGSEVRSLEPEPEQLEIESIELGVVTLSEGCLEAVR